MTSKRTSSLLSEITKDLERIEAFLVRHKPPVYSWIEWTLADEEDSLGTREMMVIKINGKWRWVYGLTRKPPDKPEYRLVVKLPVEERKLLARDVPKIIPELLKQFAEDEEEFAGDLGTTQVALREFTDRLISEEDDDA